MFVTAVDVQGFRDLPRFVASDLGPVVTVRGPTAATTALGDALELFFAAFRADGLQRWLRRIGALAPGAEAEITGAPLPEQAVWTDGVAARWVAGEARSLSVTLELALDPVQQSALRAVGAREPRLVSALARAPYARVTVGGLLASSYDALALTVQSVALGGESFPCAPGQRAPWMSALLGGIAGRFARHDHAERALLAGRVLEAASSWDGHGAWLRWQAALVPTLGVARAARLPDGRAVLLADDLPLRRLGPGALATAALAADVHLSGADLLWAESEEAWADQSVEGDGSPLEQIWRVCRDGRLLVEPTPPGEPELAALPPLPLRPLDGAAERE